MNNLSPSRLVGVAAPARRARRRMSDIFFLIVLLFFTVADAGDFASKLTSQCTVSGSPRYLTGSRLAPANISR